MQIGNIQIYNSNFYGKNIKNTTRVLSNIKPYDAKILPYVPLAASALAGINISAQKDKLKAEEIKKRLNENFDVYNPNYWNKLKNDIDSLNPSKEKDKLTKQYINKKRIMDCITTFTESKGETNYRYDSYDIENFFNFFKNKPKNIEELEKTVKLPLKDFTNLSIYDLHYIGSKDKVEFFIENEDLRLILDGAFNQITPYTAADIISEPKITRAICEKSLHETDSSLNEDLIKNPEVIGDIFVFSCYKNAGFFTQKEYNRHVDSLKYLYANTDRNSAQLIESSINEDFESVFIRKPHNLDAAIYYIENCDSFDRDYLHSILKTDFDVRENKKVLKNLMNNLDMLSKNVKEKTRHSNKEFKNWSEKYLSDSNNIKNLIFIKGLSEEMILDAFYGVSKLTSCLYKNPENYVSGQYESLEQDKIIQNFKTQIEQNFTDRMEDILNAILATDLETIKLYLDKRLNKFSSKITEINEITPVYKGILSDMIRNGRRINKLGVPDKLSGWQKEALVDIVYNYSVLDKFYDDMNIDFDKYKTPTDGKFFILDVDSMQKDLLIHILKKSEMKDSEIKRLKPENLNWDTKYISHFASSESVDSKDLQTLIKVSSQGKFADFIKDKTNKYGKANQATEKVFNERNLNYEAWLKGIGERKFSVSGEKYTINLWNRIPQESIFDGEYTTCCTAINDQRGKYMPIYMMNTAFNIVEIKNSDGNVVGMSRCFMARTKEGKNALIIEGLEFNNKLISKMQKEKNWNNYILEITNYMEDFAQKVGGEDTIVFMSDQNPKIDKKQFKLFKKKKANISILGKLSTNKVYFNVIPNDINPNHLKDETIIFNVVRDYS